MNINKDAITLEDAMLNYEAKNIATVCGDGKVDSMFDDGYHFGKPYKDILRGE